MLENIFSKGNKLLSYLNTFSEGHNNTTTKSQVTREVLQLKIIGQNIVFFI